MGKVLLTGGNGFIATHILIQLLEKQHTVVATVRSTQKADQILQSLPEPLRSNVSFSIVADAGAPNAFDETIKKRDFDGIIHTATPFHYNIQDPHELFDPAVIGTRNILEAAHQFGPNITRVVVLSSCASVVDPAKGNWPEHVYSEADWNPITQETSLAGNPSDAYYGAKTWAEKAAWEFVQTVKPKFSLVTLCPPFVFGPVVNHVTSVKDLGTSNAHLYSFISGTYKDQEIPANSIHMWVDVRDIARAHVAAYERSEAGNNRFVITAGVYTNKQIIDVYAATAPERASNLPSRLPDEYSADGVPAGGRYSVDNSKGRRMLGLEYIPIDQTIRDFLESVKSVE